jgi:hypothetical protein
VSGKVRGFLLAHRVYAPFLDPRRDEVAEASAQPGLITECCGAFLNVDDDANRCPVNLRRPSGSLRPIDRRRRAWGAYSQILSSQGTAAGENYKAASLKNAAARGRVAAVQTGASATERLNIDLRNIDLGTRGSSRGSYIADRGSNPRQCGEHRADAEGDRGRRDHGAARSRMRPPTCARPVRRPCSAASSAPGRASSAGSVKA